MTDSGGLQEETTAPGVPCITIRENTGRPVTVKESTSVLAGTDPAHRRRGAQAAARRRQAGPPAASVGRQGGAADCRGAGGGAVAEVI